MAKYEQSKAKINKQFVNVMWGSLALDWMYRQHTHSALKTLALFYLTAVQMWTDGIILATIWLWDWSPLLQTHWIIKVWIMMKTVRPKKENRRGVGVQFTARDENKLRAAWQNAISTSTVVLIVHIKLIYQESGLQTPLRWKRRQRRGSICSTLPPLGRAYANCFITNTRSRLR